MIVIRLLSHFIFIATLSCDSLSTTTEIIFGKTTRITPKILGFILQSSRSKSSLGIMTIILRLAADCRVCISEYLNCINEKCMTDVCITNWSHDSLILMVTLTLISILILAPTLILSAESNTTVWYYFMYDRSDIIIYCTVYCTIKL